MEYSQADEKSCKRMNRRYREMAGMFKEFNKGTDEQLHQITAMFALQEGVKNETAKEYLETLIDGGLIVIKQGSNDWYYNEDAEWEQFKINI